MTRNRVFRGNAKGEVGKWRLQGEKEGCVPSQSHRREKTGVLEDIQFMSDQIMYDTLSEGKRKKINNRRELDFVHRFPALS